MPPKNVKKARAKAQTPEPKVPPKTTTPKKATPAKKANAVVFVPLPKDSGVVIPVDVNYEGPSLQASQVKNGTYRHLLKFSASSSFSLVKTVMLTEGENAGFQAVLLRPAKPFNFLKLLKEAQQRIYKFYFAQKGLVNEPIVLDGKRSETKELYAKTFAEGFKHRVGLLTVNKEVYGEAIQVFYSCTFRLDSTSTLLDFLAQLPDSARKLLKSLSVKSYIKTSARTAMHFLSSFPNLTMLHFEQGVFSEGDTAKAAKQFYSESFKLLEAIGDTKGAKDAGVDILSFGKLAFTQKDAAGDATPWNAAMVEKFKEELRAKLRG